MENASTKIKIAPVNKMVSRATPAIAIPESKPTVEAKLSSTPKINARKYSAKTFFEYRLNNILFCVIKIYDCGAKKLKCLNSGKLCIGPPVRLGRRRHLYWRLYFHLRLRRHRSFGKCCSIGRPCSFKTSYPFGGHHPFRGPHSFRRSHFFFFRRSSHLCSFRRSHFFGRSSFHLSPRHSLLWDFSRHSFRRTHFFKTATHFIAHIARRHCRSGF